MSKVKIKVHQLSSTSNPRLSKIEGLFEGFISECEFSNRLRPATIQGYIDVFKTFINVMPEIDLPDLLTTATITEFFRRLQTRERLVGKEMKVTGIRNSTARGYCNRLNSFFKWLENKKHIETNPFQEIQMPEVSYEDRRALELNEIRKIISSVLLHTPSSLVLKRDLAMIHVLLLCGLRKGELKALQISDVDLDKRLLAVRGTTSKSKITRHIPINPTLVMHLREYIKERIVQKYTTEFLFVSNNGDRVLTEHGLKHWVQKLVNHSGVKFHLHQFRHTFACNLANLNVNAIKIQKLMGHTDIRMTMTYLRSMTAEDLRGDIEKLNVDNFI